MAFIEVSPLLKELEEFDIKKISTPLILTNKKFSEDCPIISVVVSADDSSASKELVYQTLEKLKEEMKEYIKKNDAVFEFLLPINRSYQYKGTIWYVGQWAIANGHEHTYVEPCKNRFKELARKSFNIPKHILLMFNDNAELLHAIKDKWGNDGVIRIIKGE